MANEDSSVKISIALTPGTTFILTSLSFPGAAYNNANVNYRKSPRQDRKKNEYLFSTGHLWTRA